MTAEVRFGSVFKVGRGRWEAFVEFTDGTRVSAGVFDRMWKASDAARAATDAARKGVA